MSNKINQNPKHSVFSLPKLWTEPGHRVWLATTLNLSRNFANFKFPSKLDRNQEQQLVALAFEALQKCDLLKNPKLFPSERLTPIEKEFLLEHFWITDGFHQAYFGEGFVIDDEGKFLAVINVEDHLKLKIIDTKQDLENSWNQLIKIESTIGNSVDFAYQEKFGFLTSNPKISGTALEVTLYLHIPSIIHTGELFELLEKEKEDEVVAEGLLGNTQEMIGDILVAKNKCTLGLAEEYILTMMRMWATRVVVSELAIRKKLIQDKHEIIKNKIARALGLLTHSYQLETFEALNALSLVKLGIELGWVTAPDIVMHQLLFDARRAHLLYLTGITTPIEQLPKKRADYLKELTKNFQLSF